MTIPKSPICVPKETGSLPVSLDLRGEESYDTNFADGETEAYIQAGSLHGHFCLFYKNGKWMVLSRACGVAMKFLCPGSPFPRGGS